MNSCTAKPGCTWLEKARCAWCGTLLSKEVLGGTEALRQRLKGLRRIIDGQVGICSLKALLVHSLLCCQRKDLWHWLHYPQDMVQCCIHLYRHAICDACWCLLLKEPGLSGTCLAICRLLAADPAMPSGAALRPRAS